MDLPLGCVEVFLDKFCQVFEIHCGLTLLLSTEGICCRFNGKHLVRFRHFGIMRYQLEERNWILCHDYLKNTPESTTVTTKYYNMR